MLLHISNFRPVKRVLDCIRILAEVRKSGPVHLLMAGDGPNADRPRMLARELGVEEDVTFLGQAGPCRAADPESARACCCRVNWRRSGWRRSKPWRAALCRSRRMRAVCPN